MRAEAVLKLDTCALKETPSLGSKENLSTWKLGALLQPPDNIFQPVSGCCVRGDQCYIRLEGDSCSTTCSSKLQ